MKELHWDQSHQSMGKKVLVASEKNTIAYLNANDGSIGESVIGIFRLSPYITLVILCFLATDHSFSSRNMIFGLREPCTIGN